MSQSFKADKLTKKLVEYILETDKDYNKSKFISRQLNNSEDLEVEASPKKLGKRFQMIEDYLELENNEIRDAYTTGTSWKLKTLREDYGDELRELLED